MRPSLIVNPGTDADFAASIEQLLRDGVETAFRLEAALRREYPRAVVRERGLAQEATTWYVYREGSWVRSEET
jgi:hypothetical protein